MTDTPESNGSGLSLDQAAQAFGSILAGDTDTQKEHEAHPSSADAGDNAADDASAQAEDDEAAQSEVEDDADGDEQQDEPPRYRVKVGDTEVEVTLDELQRGYQRQADYTRKTQQTAEQRKAAEAALQQIAAERQQYAQTLAAAQQMIAQFVPAEPDWVALSQQDPVEAIRQRALWDRHNAQLSALRAEQERAAQAQQFQHAQSMAQFVEQQRERLLEALPEWKDGEKAKAERGRLIEWGKAAGYSDAELQSIYDARHVVALRKAMLYDELVAKRTELGKQAPHAPRAMQPGPGQTGKRGVSELTRQKERLAKTGRVEDAAAVFKSLL
jgi:hypothetical protein